MIDSFFSAELDDHAPTIDLHNLYITDALSSMESELYRLSQARYPHARIVHGIGTGALRDAIHAVLSAHPLIHDFKLESHGGSTIVLL